MALVAAGTTTAVTLPAGATMTVSGLGTHQTAPPGSTGATSKQLLAINSQPLAIGPVAVATTINLAATASGPGITYLIRQVATAITYDPVAVTSYAVIAGIEQPVGGSVTVNGHTGSTITLTAADVNAMGLSTNWAAASNTPTLTSGTAVSGTVYNNTSLGVTTLGTPIDGITTVQFGDKLMCFTAGTYTLVPAGYILGIFANSGALQTAFPAANNAGARALVGVSAPFATYQSDGSSWSIPNAGGTTVDLFGGNSVLLLPTGNNTTVWSGIGATATPAVVGTVTGRSGELASIGYVNRLAYVSAAAANSNALITTASAGLQSAAPNSSAFFPPQRARVVFSVTDALSACRMGAGFFSVTPTATVEPSTVTNMAWFAADSTDTQLTFMTCAGSGTATKTTLNAGTGFPADTNGTDVYECYIEFLGGATRQINYYIMNRATGVKASGSVTATLPAADTLLRIGAYRNTAANATACAIDVVSIAGGGFAQMGPTS